MDIKELIVEVDAQLQKEYEEYKKLHEELDKTYGGRKIEADEIEALKALLVKIQDSFSAMWPALNFSMRRNADALAITSNYTQFLENLKKNK